MYRSEGSVRPRSEMAPFRLLEDEELERPAQPRRLTFKDFAAGSRQLVALARSVVPIELAKMGDEQVVLCGRWGMEDPPAMALDSLLARTSAVSVIADRPFVLSKEHPQIEELFITSSSQTVDPELLRRLPGLVCLRLAEAAPAMRPNDLSVLHVVPALRDLIIADWWLSTIGPLEHLASLERLVIRGFIEDRRIEPVAELGRLRWLAFEGPCKGLHRLGALCNLERVEMMGVTLKSLRAFQGWSKLRVLRLGGRLHSFAGIEAFHLLEELAYYGTKLPDLAPLATLSSLRRLELTTGEKWKDFSPLEKITGLQSLDVSLGSVTTDGHIPSLDFLAGMRDLEEFWGRNAYVDDGRIDALFGLPRLRRAFLVGDLASQAQELLRRRPELDLEVVTPAAPPGPVIHPAGEIEIREHRHEGLWSIFQDLTGLVGGYNNFGADRRIRGAIRDQDRSLLGRLDFDPDADFVSITARCEADIRRVVEIIASLTEKGAEAE